MNFFAAQDKARKHTFLLVVAYVFTLALLIALTEWLLLSYMAYESVEQGQGFDFTTVYQQFDASILWGVAAVILITTFMASLYKYSQLRAGGKAVAESMDGRLLNLNSQDPDEKKILNIVEEMAIASGMPVPAVYLFEEPGINAFAAGHTPNTAVIGVTRGCIRFLEREELQGVIAHEFSHIFNGDMRFNLHLITTLYGITFIGLIGQIMMRSLYYGSPRSVTSRNNRSSEKSLPLVGLSIGLMLIGYVGMFFGSLIRAAISRQREYLADATAVRYTRNNDGIAKALKKIGGYGYHAVIGHPGANEFGHLFFAEGVGRSLTQLFATHPPLKQRIRAIQPRWNGRYPKVELPEDLRIHPDILYPEKKQKEPPAAKSKKEMFISGTAILSMIDRRQVTPFDDENLQFAQTLIQSIPSAIYKAAHESYGARALCYVLLIDKNQENVRKRQLQRLQINAFPDVYKTTIQLLPTVQKLGIELHLPLVELCIVALRMLSKTEFNRFKENIEVLIQADRKLDVFEWCLSNVVLKHMHLDEKKIKTQKIKKLSSVKNEYQTLLLFLVKQQGEEGHAEDRLHAALKALGYLDDVFIDSIDAPSFFELNQALEVLEKLDSSKKAQLIKSCVICLTIDGQIEAQSYMLLRVISDWLDIPLPAVI